MEDDDNMAGETESAAPETPKAAAPPSSPAPAAVNAIYLTDKELLEMQSMTDDGEVAE
jgi:hypothetical protein